MSKKKLRHVERRLTEEERARQAQIRETAMQDIPPKPGVSRAPSPPGIPARIRQAREAQGLTWYALAKVAGIPNQATIRDIEQGKDVKRVGCKTGPAQESERYPGRGEQHPIRVEGQKAKAGEPPRLDGRHERKVNGQACRRIRDPASSASRASGAESVVACLHLFRPTGTDC